MEQSIEQTTGRVMLPPLPNSTTVLVLGILSIVTCWCFGLVGLVMGIIGLVLANKGSREYNDNFGQYSETSFKNIQAGKICAIIGTCLSAIACLYYVVYLFVIGTIFSGLLPWKELFNQ